MDISQFKNIPNAKSHKLVKANLCDFIGFYFGIFASPYDLYKKLSEYYLMDLGYSSQQVQEIFDDFCKNLNKQIIIKIEELDNFYVNSFILDNNKYYEFDSVDRFKI